MRGFVNSWAVAIIALSLVVLFTAMYSININMQNVDAGYAAELARWEGDFDNVSSVSGDCDKGILGRQLHSGKFLLSDTLRNRTVVYSGRILDFNLTLEKNYPPYVDFKSPTDNSKIDCVNYPSYTFSWYMCDPDQDSVHATLYMDGSVIGETDQTAIEISCDKLTKGNHVFSIVATDGELTYTDRVMAYVNKTQ